MNIEGRLKKLEDKVMSPVDNKDILSISGDTIEELIQNALETIREAIKKGQSWDYVVMICPAELDIDPVEQSIREEFGRGPKRIWIIPIEAIPEGW